ncbi:peptidase S8/S53 domain-containing protein [Fomitopsis serialis]|uniref:peptidase S8/S53 domain-containing protein n=1 Tax=Fomitopsis serialis TaxID=139415 RepID=UPI002007676D|nr:peptidase S8/S53 domain-containing protein [Neoantrodia serialis]KAH9924392.1 peptidase S8/S53 domain-containing protein [Neoantrodia serialis]
MVFAGLLKVAALLPLAASGVLCRSVPKYRRDTAAPGFSLTGAAAPDTPLTLKIALTQSNPSGLEDALYDVSTPSSPNYGQHLSKAEAASYVAPTSETVSTVNSWLQKNGLSSTIISPAGDWISIQPTVSQANELFSANYNVYVHDDTGKQVLRTLGYAIPEELAGHVSVVHPTVMFPKYSALAPVFSSQPKKRQQLRADDLSLACGLSVTPACLQSLYGIPTTPATESSNTLGVTGYGDDWANKADLESFLSQYRTDMASSTTYTLETLDDGSDPQTSSDAGVEADLDIEYTVGIATGVPVTFISVGETTNDGDLDGFLDTINYLLGQDSPPQVITTSYGDWEPDIDEGMAVNLCNAYAQLGARGVSIMFASGDGGVSGVQDRDCTTFVPEFPSGCPYITSVGGTTGTLPETAVYFSGGGFSNYWARPSYQSTVVPEYLDYLGSTYSGLYNTSGRGFPDVATQAQDFEIVTGGSTETVSGTSCASPTFAAIISLLNDELIAAGKSPLGFLNPWLYSTAASALTDITSGDNPGCNTTGFSATTGWDPVTGLGTPVFSKLKTAAGL